MTLLKRYRSSLKPWPNCIIHGATQTQTASGQKCPQRLCQAQTMSMHSLSTHVGGYQFSCFCTESFWTSEGDVTARAMSTSRRYLCHMLPCPSTLLFPRGVHDGGDVLTLAPQGAKPGDESVKDITRSACMHTLAVWCALWISC
jgi:hypothetical protein